MTADHPLGERTRKGLEPHPCCDACGAPYLAWQIAVRCVLWRCPRCGYIRRDLDLSPAQARAREYGGDSAADSVRLRLTVARLRRRLGPRLHGRLLEWGCGDGRLARTLAPAAREVVGVDPHAPAPDGGRVRFRQGRLEDLDEPDGSFDVILGIHVLEHVVDLLAALRSCRRMLAPEGTAYFVTPNADSAGLRLFREAWWMLEDPTHVRFVSVASVPYLAGRTGFARCSVRRLRTDSLMVEAASTARALRCSDPRAGALSSTGVRIAAAGALPATLAWRSIRPSWSPSLEVMLRGVRR